MSDDHRVPSDDHDEAAGLSEAREILGAAGASRLHRRPWQHPGQPPSDADLVRFAAWVLRDPDDADRSVLEAGLRLLASARAELDQVEAGLMFAARAAGMTWPEIARALGLSSPQAAQQRLHRVALRAIGPEAEA